VPVGGVDAVAVVAAVVVAIVAGVGAVAGTEATPTSLKPGSPSACMAPAAA
jgi:hypothetical protein